MQLESLLVVLSPGTIQLFIFGAFPELIHVLYMYLKASGLAPKHFLMQLTINPDIDLVLYSTFLSFFFAGSRMDKQWFLVRDSKQEIDAVLTMVPWSLQCMLSFNKATRKTLKELFSLLQVCMYMYKWRKTTFTCQ